MKSKTAPNHQVRIYLSGPIETAKQVLREECLADPICVTVDPTHYIYTGGEETGYVIGLLNYPRFPTTLEKLMERAVALAGKLIDRTFQRSGLVVGPETTIWVYREEKNSSEA
jgi:hypothetical protein